MRIALIAGEYPPLQGGLGDFTRELARACALAGHEAHVVTRVVPGAPAEEIAQGVHAHRIMPAWDWGALLRLRRFLDSCRPDVVNLQYQAAAYHMHPAINLLPRLFAARIPVVVTFHDLKVPYLFPKAGAARWWAIRDMARCARACIATNVEDRDTLRQAGAREVEHIPIGSNIAPAPLRDFDRAAWRRARSAPAGAPAGAALIGYFGFMNESKGGETLVRALAALCERGVDARLLFIGGQTGASDPTNVAYARYITQLADELRVSERMARTGFLDDLGVSEALAACDCIALPYRDGASFRRGTLMAALAHGCAVVTTTPRVILPELEDGANVALVAPEDAGALAGAIQRVLADSDLRARLQAGARRASELFGWDRIAARTILLFNRLISI
jgi:glycosyltransferase involved in cell wall biosynthesis